MNRKKTLRLDGVGKSLSILDDTPGGSKFARGSLKLENLTEFSEWCQANGYEMEPSRRLIANLETIVSKRKSYNEKLYDYQVEGCEFLSKNKIAFLFDEMGLGKTAQALSAIPPGSKTIIVCPAYLKTVWRNEALQWSPWCNIRTCKTKIDFRYPQQGEVVICNYEQIPDDPDKYGKAPIATYLIADEAHYVKTWKSKRTRNFRKVSKRILDQHGSVWMLTGTPVMNKPTELWAILQAVQLGNKIYKSYDSFIRKFGGCKDGLGIVRWNKQPQEDAIDPVRPFALRRTREEVLPELPIKTYKTILVELGSSVLRKKMDLFATKEEDVTEENIRSWSNIQEIATLRRELAIKKMSTVFRMVEEFEESGIPIVVFSCHRDPIESFSKRPGWGVIMGGLDGDKRNRIVEEYQSGNLRGLACTIKSAGTGITLTRSSHAIFVDVDWSPSNNLQAEDRLLRIGQKNHVLIQQVLFDHPLDYHVAKVISKKQRMINEVINVIKKPNDIDYEKIKTVLAHLKRSFLY